MFQFGATPKVEFLPEPDAQGWVAERLQAHRRRFDGPAITAPLLDPAPCEQVKNSDALLALFAAVQREVGLEALDVGLAEVDDGGVPPGFVALGNPEGQMLHTFHHQGEYVVACVAGVFRVPELLGAAVAREIGRIAIHAAGGHEPDVGPEDFEADAELAAVTLGLGAYVANGSYIFENSCCGGGCGIDLKSLRAGLSMPEACFAAAADARLRGLSARAVAKHLSPTQAAAFKSAYRAYKKRVA